MKSNLDVWTFDIPAELPVAGWQSYCLPPKETQRANSYLVSHAQRRFLFGRIVLRCILSLYTGLPPRSIELTYTSGKPMLRSMFEPPLYFNLSHSKDLLVIAVTTNGETGIDIEFIENDDRLFESLWDRLLTDQEREMLGGLSPSDQIIAMHDAWVMKESYLKAKGTGITHQLSLLEILNTHQKINRGVCYLKDEVGETWTIVRLDVQPSYRSAVAIKGRSDQLKIVITKIDLLALGI